MRNIGDQFPLQMIGFGKLLGGVVQRVGKLGNFFSVEMNAVVPFGKTLCGPVDLFDGPGDPKGDQQGENRRAEKNNARQPEHNGIHGFHG